jgi:hypothetical protein
MLLPNDVCGVSSRTYSIPTHIHSYGLVSSSSHSVNRCPLVPMPCELPTDVLVLLEPHLDVAALRQMRTASRTFAALYTSPALAQFDIKQDDRFVDQISPRVEQLLANIRLAHLVRRVAVHYTCYSPVRTPCNPRCFRVLINLHRTRRRP